MVADPGIGEVVSPSGWAELATAVRSHARGEPSFGAACRQARSTPYVTVDRRLVRAMRGRTSRVRPRLSRTVARARWTEYRLLLLAALDRGYTIVSLEDWFSGEDDHHATLVLRHDVDQDPRAVLAMAAVERRLGLTSTWYFRWRTAHPHVIQRIRSQGGAVGLHYETLTRYALGRGGWGTVRADDLEHFREALRDEIREFSRRFGPIRSVCPHGDSRVPQVRNSLLLRDSRPEDFGVCWDGTEAMRGRRLGHWLTDRSVPEGRWKDRTDPLELLANSVSPILCLTHPNNWSSGLSLWTDRLLAGMIPHALHGRPRWLIHSRTDEPLVGR